MATERPGRLEQFLPVLVIVVAVLVLAVGVQYVAVSQFDPRSFTGWAIGAGALLAVVAVVVPAILFYQWEREEHATAQSRRQ
ncbi:hypothetical protein [Natronorubrum daqingense]|uniref:Uncharacterized protein n=1 Tax=Natronorubrum daqingense TaxID=588898 RepID=A0A1N7A3Z0_9EURY|nr:hypothetical protein [Natronorubrum daqingense]APX95148.1 hypothetical protein BB347_00220 [Natronorubrum daqingense]SIR33870.1 hypothetical protein SAMN05421809_1024 [Natronorubrum daqingense]